MNKQTKLIDHFDKVSENYSVTMCANGFFVEASGQDKEENWINVRFVVNTLDELKDVVQDLAWMPRS